MFYLDRIKTNLLQVFVYPENSGWFSIISVGIFEVNIIAQQKQSIIGNDFLFFTTFYCPQLFYCSLPYRCSGVPAASNRRPSTHAKP